MGSAYHARKKHKQRPFLNALERFGTISAACRIVRISRDAVHDWRAHDREFAHQFTVSKYRYKTRGWIVFPVHTQPVKNLPVSPITQGLVDLERRREIFSLGLYEAAVP